MHYRRRIRDAVRDRLTAANTLAGPNVFTSRAKPVLEVLQRREAVLSVYTADEASESTDDAHLLVRTLTVSIEGMAGGGDDLDDTLDDMAEQVEAAIAADDTLGALLHRHMVLTATTSEISARGNMQVGAFRLDYECQYLTQRIAEGETFPIPDKVFTNPQPHGDRYTELFEEFDTQPPASSGSACVDGICDTPAWGGDRTDEGTQI